MTVKAYHEDIVILEKKGVVTIGLQQQVLCCIELKNDVHMMLKSVKISDIVETLLYGLYYIQERTTK